MPPWRGAGRTGREQRAVKWIERNPELQAVVEEIGGGPLAVDTEADSFHHYREKICLIQLSYRESTALVDPLSGLDPSPLKPVLSDRAVRKVLHGADYDLRLLARDFGIEVAGLFDTMIAARLVGERAFGLAALLETRLGVRLDKSRPLLQAPDRRERLEALMDPLKLTRGGIA